MIAIFEPCANGHRLWYVRLVAEAALEAGRTPIWVTLPGAAASAEYGVHLQHLGESLQVLQLSSASSQTARFLVGRPLLVQAYAALSADIPIILLDADNVVPQWLTLPRVRNRAALGLVTRPPRLKTSRSAAKRFLLRVAEKRGMRLVDLGRDPSSRGVRPSVDDPPPRIDRVDRAAARIRLGVSPTDKVLLIAGTLDDRKNVEFIVRAHTAASRPEHCLLLAGRPSGVLAGGRLESLIDAARKAGANIKARLGYLDERDFLDAFASSDVVLALYSNANGLSGVGMYAHAVGSPCIVYQNRHLAREVNAGRLAGVVMDELSEQAYRQSVDDALAIEHCAVFHVQASEQADALDFGRQLVRLADATNTRLDQ